MRIYIRRNGKLKSLDVADHGILLGVSAISPQDTVQSMLDSFSMTKQRCYNENCPDYKYYGARGVKVCQRWLDDPINMVIDMGLRPEGYTLERKDNGGPYSPSNCTWLGRLGQMQNTRQNHLVEYGGERKCIAEWERVKGFKPGTLKARLTRLGYSVDEAMTKPVKCGGLLEGRNYPHLADQSWRVTAHLKEKKPKFDKKDASAIRTMYEEGHSRSYVARMFGTTVTTVSSVINRVGAYRND